jgi:probable rRNA maturation factor
LTIPADPDSLRSDDGRVEVVLDLEELPNSELTQSAIPIVIEAAVAALDAEHNEGADHVTVMITGDERIRELNREFKDEDEVTDVLSFNEKIGTAGKDEDAWPELQGIGKSDELESDRLGDIAISLPQVKRQAAENGKPPERELAMLTVHGVLHLLGHDHAEPDEEKIMFGKTDAVLAGMFPD